MSGDVAPALTSAQLAAIYEHARAEFPRECCGYLLGRGPDAEVVACTNRQDALHAIDPEAYPRTSANGYEIGGKELLALTRSFDGPRPASIVYHSHPRVGAYFSDEDVRAALAAQWPVDYLVVDAQDDRIAGAKLFSRRGDAFVAIASYPAAPL